jgi:putative transposase
MSTFLSLHYHVVFSTKHRRPFISPSWREEFYRYISGGISGLGGFPQGVGGVNDHVHLLAGLKATHCLSDFMRELKKQTSIWARDNHCRDFGWQDGYSAFTISATGRVRVQKYIQNQEVHHQKESFHDELKRILCAAGVPFEEKFLD